MRALFLASTLVWFFIQTASVVAQNKLKATPANVTAAIEKSVSFLRKEQNTKGVRSGSWTGHENYGCGQTALVTLALLSAGRDAKSPEISRALTFIRASKPEKTYEASLKIMALCAAEPSRDMAQIKTLVEWLAKKQSGDGGWAYGDSLGSSDESNTQFAVLALWEASKIGIAIPKEIFTDCYKYWSDNRVGDAWGYRGSTGATGSMTCAGIASMLILQDAASGVDASVKGNAIQCCGGGENNEFDVNKSILWLARNFSVYQNPNSSTWTLYYLYALERVGRLTGQRFLGEHDWYREGAEYLLQIQSIGGSFQGGNIESDAVTSTAMALLFLSKGKRQVVIGHLQFGNDGDWQLHRRAVQNLTGQIENVWKRELAWQAIRLEQATLPSLLETPVLFISGSRQFKLSEGQRKLLFDYVENGGFIFAEACNGNGCSGDAFDKSFRSEMEAIFDKPLQKLPPSHPIWTAEAKVDPNAMPKDFWLYGLDACCRTTVVYSPISLSCRWEIARPFGLAAKQTANVETDIQNAVKLGVNVAAYATGRELKEKLGDVQIIQVQKDKQPLARGSLTLPKIMHTGGADETTKAVANLLEVYRLSVNTLVESKTPMVSLISEELEKFPVLYIHGRSKFQLAEAELAGLQKHFEFGGFVIGDAVCANPEFADAVRKEFSRALPESFWITLPPKHPIIQSRESFGFDLSNVSLIDPTSPNSDLKQATRQGPAEILALEWKGKIVMLFSPNDLSCAMESKHSMQCRGYVREDAFKIGINMLLFALGMIEPPSAP